MDYCYLSVFKLYFNECYKEYKDNFIFFIFLFILGFKNNLNVMKEII